MRMRRFFWLIAQRPRDFVLGEEIFEIGPGVLASVMADKGDRIQVKALNGSWKDRIGWIASDEVRPRPTLKTD